MDDIEYWEEMVGESFCQNDVKYEPEKIKSVAKDMSSAHEHYGQAFYQPPVSEHPVFAELEYFKNSLPKKSPRLRAESAMGEVRHMMRSALLTLRLVTAGSVAAKGGTYNDNRPTIPPASGRDWNRRR